jgi:hypothetical protein
MIYGDDGEPRPSQLYSTVEVLAFARAQPPS